MVDFVQNPQSACWAEPRSGHAEAHGERIHGVADVDGDGNAGAPMHGRDAAPGIRMFSSLPKLADRTFVVGYLLPTLLFVCALAALFADQPLVQGLIFGETQGWDKIFGLVIAIWAAAVFLQFVNTYLIKFLEGYESPIKNWRSLKAERQSAFDALDGRLNELWEKINARVELSEAENMNSKENPFRSIEIFPQRDPGFYPLGLAMRSGLSSNTETRSMEPIV